MSHDRSAELPYCRNCHYTLSTPRPIHCGHCGQETDLHPPSVREMVTEYLGHYVALDGPLWRTLGALIALPGHLTTAYFHGQRRRYVLPLRVYLSASFLFFVGTHLLHLGAHTPDPQAAATVSKPGTLQVQGNATPAETARAAERLAQAPNGPRPEISTKLDICEDTSLDPCSPPLRWARQLLTHGATLTRDQWVERVTARAPYAMLAMQPVFAALLLVMFAGSGRRYAEHFVFSLHSHSLWFLALLLTVATGLESLAFFAVFAHGLVALRRVYALSWWGTTWRGVLLSLGYCALLLLATLGLLAWIAATAPGPGLR